MNLPPESTTDVAATAVGNLSEDDTAILRDRLGVLIEAREAGIRYAESRLNGIAFLSTALLAAAIAVLSIGLGESATWIKAGLLTLAGGLSVLAGCLLIIYTRSTNPDYPFISKTSEVTRGRWKWFYRDTLPDPRSLATFGLWGRHRRDAHASEVTETDRQFPEFVSRMVAGLTDGKTDTADDLRQLYILHINERYKNQYLKNERTVLQRGLAALAVLTVAVFGIGALFALLVDDSLEGSSAAVVQDVAFTFAWKEESHRDTSVVRLSVNIDINNLSNEPYEFRRLIPIDAAGFVLASSVDSIEGIVPAGASQEIIVEAVVPVSYAPAISAWKLE